VDCQGKLFHFVGALGTARRFPRRLYGRQQQRHQDANNRDHDQQFDKCEGNTMSS
jgi:hypothetical protein